MAAKNNGNGGTNASRGNGGGNGNGSGGTNAGNGGGAGVGNGGAAAGRPNGAFYGNGAANGSGNIGRNNGNGGGNGNGGTNAGGNGGGGNGNGSGGTNAGNAVTPALGYHSAAASPPATSVGSGVPSPTVSVSIPHNGGTTAPGGGPAGNPGQNGNGGTPVPIVGTPPINPNYNDTGTGGVVGTPPLNPAAQPPASSNTGGITTSATNVQQSSSQGGYIVASGDTLSGIAQTHGVALADLEAMNPQIKNPDLIFPGQSINIGNGATDQSAVPAPVASPAAAPGATAPPASPAVSVLPTENSANASGTNTPADKSDPAKDKASHDAAAAFTQTDTGFPTSSTYPPAESKKALDEKVKELSDKAKGWGIGNVSTDPAKGVVYVSDNKDTNPLIIKDRGHRNRPIS